MAKLWSFLLYGRCMVLAKQLWSFLLYVSCMVLAKQC